MIEAAILVIFPFCMIYAAASDMLSMTISNRVPLLLVGTFLVVAPLSGMGWTDLSWHLVAGLVVLAFGFAMFAIRAMGGGDAKLMASTALWFGFRNELLDYLVTSALLGAVLTLMLISFRKSPLATLASQNALLKHMADQKAGIPYGIALGAGALVTFPNSPLGAWALSSLSLR
ncbi:MAG: prepilin peptidase [Mesorhizobium sp.]|jgi:prepilin peptidase CpaA